MSTAVVLVKIILIRLRLCSTCILQIIDQQAYSMWEMFLSEQRQQTLTPKAILGIPNSL